MTGNHVSLLQIADAIAGTLSTIQEDWRVQTAQNMTESIPETPLLQVYPERGSTDSGSSSDRASFRAGIRRTDVTIFADLYARQRSDISTDLRAAFELFDEIERHLIDQQVKPYFGLPEIKSFNWQWERVTFEYGDPNLPYVGIRITFMVKVF